MAIFGRHHLFYHGFFVSNSSRSLGRKLSTKTMFSFFNEHMQHYVTAKFQSCRWPEMLAARFLGQVPERLQRL